VTPNGLALSIETEFVENVSPQQKQDCELKAFYRLVSRLKKRFPQLRICLLLDALYANETVIKICEEYHWKYFITFKPGSLPETYREYEALRELSREHTVRYQRKGVVQRYCWVNGLNYQFKDRYVVNVLECWEYHGSTRRHYLWLTNFPIDHYNCHYLANRGARLRWKTENEGFNMQKHGGYNLEHAYSKDLRASQLLEKGSLVTKSVWASLGSIKNIARRLLEELRTGLLDIEALDNELSTRFQIRFDTS